MKSCGKHYVYPVTNCYVILAQIRVRKIYFNNEKHDIEETNTETFMCRSMTHVARITRG